MADGVLPSNEGRGYVLRRIMRRAMRHAHILGAREPLMHRLVPTLLNEMGGAYSELKRAEALLVQNLRLEEERFKQTLERGLRLLEDETSQLAAGGTLAGETAFKLYDTFGFPLDLTQDILRGQKMHVDTTGFDKAMAEQKTRARAAWAGSGDTAQGTLWLELRDRLGATEFLGYSDHASAGQITAIVRENAEVAQLAAGEEGWVVTNQTPFYGESGGQLGDTGFFKRNGQIVAEVLDTKKPADGFVAHKVKALIPLKTGDELELEIDNSRRDRSRANHSATHLLNAALKRVLGEHITQKGSEVGPEKLRFDISHPKALSSEEIAAVEVEVNQQIWHNTPATTKLMATTDAIEAGAVAMFGEKYGDEVRVLAIGTEDEKGAYSVELCGGTHVHRTGDIGLFKITSESALAAGVRRIEAVTRDGAFAYLNGRNEALQAMAMEAKIPVNDVAERFSLLQAEKKKLEKELADAKRKLALGGSGDGASFEKEQIGDFTFAWRALEGIEAKDLRGIAGETLQQSGAQIVAVGSNADGKAAIVITVAPGATGRFDSAALIRVATPAVGGQGGGGRAEFAQGGGPNGGEISKALEAVKAELTKLA